jgi:hypothetical protein
MTDKNDDRVGSFFSGRDEVKNQRKRKKRVLSDEDEGDEASGGESQRKKQKLVDEVQSEDDVIRSKDGATSLRNKRKERDSAEEEEPAAKRQKTILKLTNKKGNRDSDDGEQPSKDENRTNSGRTNQRKHPDSGEEQAASSKRHKLVGEDGGRVAGEKQSLDKSNKNEIRENNNGEKAVDVVGDRVVEGNRNGVLQTTEGLNSGATGNVETSKTRPGVNTKASGAGDAHPTVLHLGTGNQTNVLTPSASDAEREARETQEKDRRLRNTFPHGGSGSARPTTPDYDDPYTVHDIQERFKIDKYPAKNIGKDLEYMAHTSQGFGINIMINSGHESSAPAEFVANPSKELRASFELILGNEWEEKLFLMAQRGEIFGFQILQILVTAEWYKIAFLEDFPFKGPRELTKAVEEIEIFLDAENEIGSEYIPGPNSLPS